MFTYPARTRRSASILQTQEKFQEKLEGVSHSSRAGLSAWIAGRVVGFFENGFVLKDESAEAKIFGDAEERVVHLGDIVEVHVNPDFSFCDLKILAPHYGDFLISKSAPNYLKIGSDQKLKQGFLHRSVVFQKIRQFFYERGFLEVDTPLLVRLPGMEPYLDVFKTRFFADSQSGHDPDRALRPKSEDLYLITSPEYALKKLLVGGCEKIFQLGHCFRNKETNSDRHNPEFTLLEWYRAYASYLETMKDMEELVQFLARAFFADDKISYGDAHIRVGSPWPRLKVWEAFRNYAGIERTDFEDVERLRKVVAKKGYRVDAKTTYDDLFFIVFMNEIEPKLGFDRPVILYEYPVSMASLSKKCEDDPRYAERFELYIAGMEFCNAFTELNDPVEQRQRLEEERRQRQALGKDDYDVDQKFLGALEFGMPPSSGVALGGDRLVMLLTGASDIRDVLFFPHRDL